MSNGGENPQTNQPYKQFYTGEFMRYFHKFYAQTSSFSEINRLENKSEQNKVSQILSADEELEMDLGRPATRNIIGDSRNGPITRRTPFTEVNFYLKDIPEALPKGHTPLDWWRINEGKYPALANMARDFLAVPIAGVGVERIFSLARDIVTYRRNRLKGVTIADLLIAKEYWRTYEDQALNTEEVKEEVKIREEEFDDRRWADNPDNLAISDAEDDFENSASSENSAEEETEERENAHAKKRKRLGVSAHRNIVYTYGNQG
jgi:hypothetical protein